MRNTLLAAIAAIGLVGCVGGIDSGTPPKDDKDKDTDTDTGTNDPGNSTNNQDNPTNADLSEAKKLYDDNVYSIMAAKCTNGACHQQAGTAGSATKFVATAPADGWEIAVGYTAFRGNFTPTNAGVLTMIASGHQGASYTGDEIAKITAWLNKEVELRNGTIPPADGGSEALATFAGCMTMDNFNAANMAEAWGRMEAQNNQECDNCHATGGYGFVANRADVDLVYNALTKKKYYLMQYIKADLTVPDMPKVIINMSSFIGVANAQDPHREHPRFDCQEGDCNNPGMTALKEFYDKTMADWTAGACGPNTARPPVVFTN
jgi:hypothetical protein